MFQNGEWNTKVEFFHHTLNILLFVRKKVEIPSGKKIPPKKFHPLNINGLMSRQKGWKGCKDGTDGNGVKWTWHHKEVP
jgi:hypothetical protein